MGADKDINGQKSSKFVKHVNINTTTNTGSNDSTPFGTNYLLAKKAATKKKTGSTYDPRKVVWKFSQIGAENGKRLRLGIEKLVIGSAKSTFFFFVGIMEFIYSFIVCFFTRDNE